MNDTDAVQVEAGPELDALVCQRLGIKGRSDFFASSDNGASGYFFSPRRREVEEFIAGHRERNPGSPLASASVAESVIYPRVSESVAAAWPAVEKLGLSLIQSEDGWYAIKPHDIEHGNVRGTDHPKLSLIGEEGEHFEASETAALAICRAALAAVTP